MKIQLPISTVRTGGTLFNFYYNLVQFNNSLAVNNDGTTVFIESDVLFPSFNEVEDILIAGGEVLEYLMAVQMPASFLGGDVPAGLPNRINVLGETRSVKNWFNSTAEIWGKNDGSEVIFYTNPVGLSVNQYLKGSEIKLINDLSVQINILKISEAQAIIDGGGYSRV